MQFSRNYLKNFIYPYDSLRFKLATLKARYHDWRLGIQAQEESPALEPDISLCNDMRSYSATLYGRLEKIVKYLKLSPDDVFVDLGSGKGRVVFFVAAHKLKKVIGVELDKNLFELAQDNLRKLKINKTPVSLINIDAVNFISKEGTIFYIFNPFGYQTLEKVLKNIKDSLLSNPRRIRIVYYSPVHRQLLDNQDWLIFDGQIENEVCLVWQNSHSSPKVGDA